MYDRSEIKEIYDIKTEKGHYSSVMIVIDFKKNICNN